MKILMANKFFYMNGGSERVFFQERDFLMKEGHTVIDFSMQDECNLPSSFSNLFVPNISYQKAKCLLTKIKNGACFVHSPVAVKNIKKLILKYLPQIAHLHNIYHQLTPSIIPVLRKYGIKVVLTLHDYKLACPSYLALKNNEICNDCEGRKFWKPFMSHCQNSRSQEFLLSAEALFHKWRGSYDDVDLFIAPSQFLADLTCERVSKNKIRVLHNAIDIDEYQPHYDDEGYALYFGRISKEKGVFTLLEANAILRGYVPLKIVGTGPLQEKLMMTYPEAEFLGYKSGQELKDLVANAAFVVVPSEWYENCSMAVLEAMALGKPIVASQIGGIPEQVEDGKSGFLFAMGDTKELANKMLMLAEDKNLRLEFGHAARNKIEREYSLKDHCSKLLDIYHELLGK